MGVHALHQMTHVEATTQNSAWATATETRPLYWSGSSDVACVIIQLGRCTAGLPQCDILPPLYIGTSPTEGPPKLLGGGEGGLCHTNLRNKMVGLSFLH